MLASCLTLCSHQIRCCNENAAFPILFFNETPCGPAAWVVDEFHHRLNWPLKLSLTQLFGCRSPRHAVDACTTQRTTGLDSFVNVLFLHFNYVRRPCDTFDAQPCLLLLQRRMWCEHSSIPCSEPALEAVVSSLSPQANCWTGEDSS